MQAPVVLTHITKKDAPTGRGTLAGECLMLVRADVAFMLPC